MSEPLEDPDAALPEGMLRPIAGPRIEIVFPSDPEVDAHPELAQLFPDGLILVDFRTYAPSVLLA